MSRTSGPDPFIEERASYRTEEDEELSSTATLMPSTATRDDPAHRINVNVQEPEVLVVHQDEDPIIEHGSELERDLQGLRVEEALHPSFIAGDLHRKEAEIGLLRNAHTEYIDSTPKTPLASRPNSSASSHARRPEGPYDSRATDDYETRPRQLDLEGAGGERAETAGDATSEIQSILEQFDKDSYGSEEQDSTSAASPMHLVQPPGRPPGNSSPDLPHAPGAVPAQNGQQAPSVSLFNRDGPTQEQATASLSPKIPPVRSTRSGTVGTPSASSSVALQGSPPSRKSLPPEPEPESNEIRFNFHLFLEQLRHRTADPVAKFLRSFLTEFGKKQWAVHEQVKIVRDFLTFITGKMAQCEVWRDGSDAEFDNAKEGMEKLVMNRLYSQTFSPAIPPPSPTNAMRGRRRGDEKSIGPGRRGQHQEDVERDHILAQRMRIFGWVREEHLDITPIEGSGRRFLTLAQQELLKIRTYRAPRDKVICVLNCCKVIFGLLRSSTATDTSADSFMPLLIYTVLRANPEHLVSNVQYIFRFRSQEKLGGEAGYYLSSLMAAIQFIEHLDRTSLSVTDEEFEKHVEASVSAIAERQDSLAAKELPKPRAGAPDRSEPRSRGDRGHYEDHGHSEKHAQSSDSDSEPSVAGLLRTIQKPLSSIGRIFSDDQSTSPYANSSRPAQAPNEPDPARRLSPAVFRPPRDGADIQERPSNSGRMTAEDAAARQASAEAAEARRIQRAEHKDVVDTLASMFPNLERDVISDIVRAKEARIGAAVDACLALNA